MTGPNTTPDDDRGRELASIVRALDLACEGISNDPARFETRRAVDRLRVLAAPAEAGDDERPGHWITEECARARARFEQLPRGARPVVTRPVEAQRAAATPPAPEGEAELRWTVSTPEDSGALGTWLVQGWTRWGPGKLPECRAEIAVGPEQDDDADGSNGRLAWRIRDYLATPTPAGPQAEGAGETAGGDS